MGPTGDLGDCRGRRKPRLSRSRFIECGKAAIAIGLQKAAEVGEMSGRVLAAAVEAVEVGRRRWCRATERPVIADIDP
jgi:hypothetical protein